MSAAADLAIGGFRPMVEDDLSAVMAIERQAYNYPWTENIFRDCLRVGYCCWVLDRTGGVEAYAIMNVAAGESHILNLCVDPSRQGQGVGQAMLRQMVRVARMHRADTMFLEVRPSNEAAVRLYEGAGFMEVGMRRGYYPAPGGREDARIFALALDRPSDGKPPQG